MNSQGFLCLQDALMDFIPCRNHKACNYLHVIHSYSVNAPIYLIS